MSTAADRRATLSIVVPVLNEAELLPGLLLHLRAAAPGAELVVADGGSGDGSVELARAAADRVVTAPRGRAPQLNAGARAARGTVLWFVHADARLPLEGARLLLAALEDDRMAGGCFRLRLPRAEPIFRLSDSLGNLGVDLFRMALGDHAIFCRRRAYEAVGGYPDWPILEDAGFYRRLGRVGRVRQLGAHVEASPRAYLRHGPARLTAIYALILLLYTCGVPPARLERLYCRLLHRLPPPPR